MTNPGYGSAWFGRKRMPEYIVQVKNGGKWERVCAYSSVVVAELVALFIAPDLPTRVVEVKNEKDEANNG